MHPGNLLCRCLLKSLLHVFGLLPVSLIRTVRRFNMGLINAKNSLSTCEKISASSFCRRRLPVVMVRMKMSETLREAVTFIEQAHVRVGPDTITDPAFLVTRNLEDFVTWVDSSKIRRHIQKYNDALDDFDLLGN